MVFWLKWFYNDPLRLIRCYLPVDGYYPNNLVKSHLSGSFILEAF